MRGHRGAAAAAAVGVMVLVGIPGAASMDPTGAIAKDCRLVRLEEPERGRDGSVVDIEKIGRKVVYYGTTQLKQGDGTRHHRALVWRGRQAEPERVGPRGFDDDFAMGLTGTGLVNGHSLDRETGESRAWVQDLATGELTFFDLDSGPRGGDHGPVRHIRINDSGAAAGDVMRAPEPGPYAGDAVAFDSPDSEMTLLSGSADAHMAGALGINRAGDRVGYLSTEYIEEWSYHVWKPTKWGADGTTIELATPHGLSGVARSIADDGSASGSILWGSNPEHGHTEAAYWPTPDVNLGLGVLRRGDRSGVLGMDDGGWLVGFADRHRQDEYAHRTHGFLWTPTTAPNHLRILPSLRGDRRDQGWRKWRGSTALAVDRDLNQAGGATPPRYRGNRLVVAPTVYLRADRCGVERPTNHDDWAYRGTQDRLPSFARATRPAPLPRSSGQGR